MHRFTLRMIAAAVAASCLASAARAELVEWTLTSASFLKVEIEIYIDGEFAGMLAPQGPGADTASFSGTLTTELSGSSIAFQGGQMVAAITGNWDPLNDGQPGLAPANYGHLWDLEQFGSVLTAIRDTSGHLVSGALPLSGDPNLLSFAFDAGQVSLDYNWFLIGRSTGQLASIIGIQTGQGPRISSLSAGIGTIAKGPGLWTLTVPVEVYEASGRFDDTPIGDIATYFRYVGVVEATTIPVPEPASVISAAIGAGALALIGVLRARRGKRSVRASSS